jgi:hypothetical protein
LANDASGAAAPGTAEQIPAESGRDQLDAGTGKEWGATGASQARNPFVPPRVDLQVGSCVNSAETLAASALRLRLCQDARAALASGAWRFDGSVQMPTIIGDVDSSGHAGAFEQGMLDYLFEGPRSLEQVLQGIDKAWPG